MHALIKKLTTGRYHEVCGVHDDGFTEEVVLAEQEKFPNHIIGVVEIPGFKIADFFNAVVGTNLFLTELNETRLANGLELVDLRTELGFKLRPLIEHLTIFNIDINRTQLEVFDPEPDLVADFNTFYDYTVSLLGMLTLEELETNHTEYLTQLKAFLDKYNELTTIFLAKKEEEAEIARKKLQAQVDNLPVDAEFEEVSKPEEIDTDNITNGSPNGSVDIDEPVAHDHELTTPSDL